MFGVTFLSFLLMYVELLMFMTCLTHFENSRDEGTRLTQKVLTWLRSQVNLENFSNALDFCASVCLDTAVVSLWGFSKN